jgi:transcriptional regulator with GAF, ATPase, and Fis domain
MERAAILGNGHMLEVAKALGVEAPHGAVGSGQNGAIEMSAAITPYTPPPDGFEALDAVMAKHIEAALGRTYGRIEGPYGAAKLLGINPHTLRARMRKLGVNWKRFRHTV